MARSDVKVYIVGDASSLERTMQSVTAGADKMTNRFEQVGRRMQSIGKTMSIAVTLPILALAKMGYNELVENQKALAQTEAAIRSTGGVANVTAKQISTLASKLQDVSGTSDEVVQTGANLLLTFTNIRNEAGKGNQIFDRATKLMLDMSIAMGQDISSTAVQMGKALNDPIAGVTALRRVGVQLTDQQQESIKTFMEQGDIMSAQKVILGELTTQFGGSAKAFGETIPGQVAKARESFADMTGVLMAQAAPAIEFMADKMLDLSKWIQNLPGPVKTLITAFAGVAAVAGPVLYVAGALARSLTSLSEFASSTGARMGELGNTFSRVAGNLAKGAGLVAAVAALAYVFYEGMKAAGAFDKATSGIEVTAENVANRLRDVQFQVAEFQVKIDNVTDALNRGELSRREYERGMKNIGDATEDLRKQVRALADSSPELARQFIESAEAAGLNQKTIKLLNKEVEEAEQFKLRSAAASEKDTAKMREMSDAAAVAAGDISSLVDEFDRMIGAQLNVEQASISMDRAIEDLREVIRDGKIDTLEGRQAFLDAKESIISWGEAVRENAEASGKSTREATEDQITALSLVAETLDGPLRDALNVYIWQLRAGIPDEKHTRIVVDGWWEAVDQLGSVAAAINDLNGGRITVSGNAWNGYTATWGAGAEGAIVNRPTMALIGEAGPEVLMPLDKLPGNGSVPDLSGARTGSGAVNATFNVYTNATNGDEVVAALTRWVQNNGAVPARVKAAFS